MGLPLKNHLKIVFGEPEVVSVTPEPLQNVVGPEAAIDPVGSGFTTILTGGETEEHPFTSVTVTW